MSRFKGRGQFFLGTHPKLLLKQAEGEQTTACMDVHDHQLGIGGQIKRTTSGFLQLHCWSPRKHVVLGDWVSPSLDGLDFFHIERRVIEKTVDLSSVAVVLLEVYSQKI